MASSTNSSEEARHYRGRDIDEDDTLTEVGEEHDFGDLEEDETDAADRRRDPLRMPH